MFPASFIYKPKKTRTIARSFCEHSQWMRISFKQPPGRAVKLRVELPLRACTAPHCACTAARARSVLHGGTAPHSAARRHGPALCCTAARARTVLHGGTGPLCAARRHGPALCRMAARPCTVLHGGTAPHCAAWSRSVPAQPVAQPHKTENTLKSTEKYHTLLSNCRGNSLR